jgi:hypothetical protein
VTHRNCFEPTVRPVRRDVRLCDTAGDIDGKCYTEQCYNDT